MLALQAGNINSVLEITCWLESNTVFEELRAQQTHVLVSLARINVKYELVFNLNKRIVKAGDQQREGARLGLCRASYFPRQPLLAFDFLESLRLLKFVIPSRPNVFLVIEEVFLISLLVLV